MVVIQILVCLVVACLVIGLLMYSIMDLVDYIMGGRKK